MSEFITIEGIDGSGTTTVTERVASEIDDSIETTEPSGIWTGQVARDAFEQRETEDITRFYLFMADRVEHCEQVVKPSLEQGKTVICDRGPDSTRAYQYFTSGLSTAFIELNLDKTMMPDRTFWLDVDVDTAIERIEGKDAFENRALQEKVSERYAELCDWDDRITRIDATQPLDAVVADILGSIQ